MASASVETVLATGDREVIGKVFAKKSHLELVPVYRSVASVPFDGLSAAWNGTEQKVEVVLEPGQFHTVRGLTLRYKIAMTVANSYLVPAPYFANRVEFKGERSGIIQTIYPESQWARLAALPAGQLDDIAAAGGFSSRFWQDWRYLARSGTTVCRECPLLGTFFEALGGLDFGALKEGIRMTVYLRPSIVASGGGTTSLSNLDLLVDQVKYQDSAADKAAEALLGSKEIIGNFLDTSSQGVGSYTLTIGTQAKQKLGLAGKKVSHLVLGVRASETAVTNQGIIKFLSLDPSMTGTGLVDLVNGVNSSIFGDGSAVNVEHLKGVLMAKSFSSDFIENTNLYVLPFADNIHRSLEGIPDGFYEFSDNNHQLAITPSSTTGAAEVQTITGSAAGGAGYYQLAFDGGVSDAFAFNAAVGTVKTAFEAIPAAVNYPGGVSVTFGGTFAAAAAVTVTFSDTRHYPLIQATATAETGGAATIGATSAYTTYGVGWTTASTYYLGIWAEYFRQIRVSDGRISVTDL